MRMQMETNLKDPEPTPSFWKRAAPALGMILIFGVCLFVLAYMTGIGSLLSYTWYSWTSVEIKADEIPMYPNARNIAYQESESSSEIHNWTFTTDDDPDTVWKFYVEELGDRWGFFEKNGILTIRGCPGYIFGMASTSNDANIYEIT